MAGQLLQENNLTESSLGICRVLESIEVLLEGDYLLRPLVDGFPYDTIGTLT